VSSRLFAVGRRLSWCGRSPCRLGCSPSAEGRRVPIPGAMGRKIQQSRHDAVTQRAHRHDRHNRRRPTGGGCPFPEQWVARSNSLGTTPSASPLPPHLSRRHQPLGIHRIDPRKPLPTTSAPLLPRMPIPLRRLGATDRLRTVHQDVPPLLLELATREDRPVVPAAGTPDLPHRAIDPRQTIRHRLTKLGHPRIQWHRVQRRRQQQMHVIRHQRPGVEFDQSGLTEAGQGMHELQIADRIIEEMRSGMGREGEKSGSAWNVDPLARSESVNVRHAAQCGWPEAPLVKSVALFMDLILRRGPLEIVVLGDPLLSEWAPAARWAAASGRDDTRIFHTNRIGRRRQPVRKSKDAVGQRTHRHDRHNRRRPTGGGCPFPEQWVARSNSLGTTPSANEHIVTTATTAVGRRPTGAHSESLNPRAMGRKIQRSRHDAPRAARRSRPPLSPRTRRLRPRSRSSPRACARRARPG